MKKTRSHLALALLTMCLISGCGMSKNKDKDGKDKKDKSPGDESSRRLSSQKNDAPGGDAKDAPRLPAGKEVERKIVYTGSLKLEVQDFARAEEQLLQLVEIHKGNLEKSEIEARPGIPRSGHWRVRIPPSELADFRKAAAKLGVPEQNRLDSDEVTEEFYDLVEQIKSKEKEVESYRRLLDRAQTVADIIAIKKEVDRAQLDLDRARGRHRLLDNMTSLTRIDVSLHERGAYTPEESPDFLTSVGRTFSDSLNALGQFARGLSLFLVALAPWLPILLLIALPMIIWARRMRRTHRAAIEATPLPILNSAEPTIGNS